MLGKVERKVWRVYGAGGKVDVLCLGGARIIRYSASLETVTIVETRYLKSTMACGLMSGFFMEIEKVRLTKCLDLHI